MPAFPAVKGSATYTTTYARTSTAPILHTFPPRLTGESVPTHGKSAMFRCSKDFSEYRCNTRIVRRIGRWAGREPWMVFTAAVATVCAATVVAIRWLAVLGVVRDYAVTRTT